MDSHLACSLGHSRGRAIIDALTTVQQRLHRNEEGIDTGARLNQLEQKLDLVTEVLVSSVRELKTLEEASHSNHQNIVADLPLKEKLSRVISYMEDELCELAKEVEDCESRLRRSAKRADVQETKDRLVSSKRLLVKKQQDLLEVKQFQEVLLRQQLGTKKK